MNQEEFLNMKQFLKMCRETANENLEKAKNIDGKDRCGHGLNAATCIFLLDEIDRLQAIIDTHDLCHDLHGKVGANEFAQGCEAEQRKVFGCAPHADKLMELKTKVQQGHPIVEADFG